MPHPLRVVFAGTPEFAVPVLEALYASHHAVVAVYTQPDRPAGRGRALQPSAVKSCALARHLTVLQPATLKTAAAELAAFAPDVMVVVAYGLLLPPAILAVPRFGCVNIHASLLPRWRGAAPIQRAIEAGDAVTGVSIMQMEAGLDTGPVFATAVTPIAPQETAGELHDRLAILGATRIVAALDALASGSARPEAQPASGVTYAHKLSKEEGRIDWQRPAIELERQVRAFNPWPVATTTWRGAALRIWRAAVHESAAPDAAAPQVPGRVVAGTDVTTGRALLRLEQLQLPGKRVVTADEFLRAHVLAGELLG
jgi:methionyl-tRNA formyltransferase